MWICIHRKVHMLIGVIAFYILMCPVTAIDQSTIPYLKKLSDPNSEDKSSSQKVGFQYTTGDVGRAKKKRLCQSDPSLSDEMKDLIKFIDVRRRGKQKESKYTEGSEVVVDLDQTKVDVLGEVPKDAILFNKKVIEDGIVVDIPKSALFREKKSNPSEIMKDKKVPYPIRLFYKTSTPRFRPNESYFETTRGIWNKMFKSIVVPLKKKMGIKNKHQYPHTFKRRSKHNLRPLGIVNNRDPNIPRICQASHHVNEYTREPMSNHNLSNRYQVVFSVKPAQGSTMSSGINIQKKSEISEAALLEIINKLIKDSSENNTIPGLEKILPTIRPICTTTPIRDMQKLTHTAAPPPTTSANFNLAVIIAKITHDPEYNYPAANEKSALTILKPDFGKSWTTTGSFYATKCRETSPPVLEAEKKSRDKYQIYDSGTMNTNKKVDNNPTQRSSKDGLNGLMKEIIRHVSMALDAVTTSKEFLELASGECTTNKYSNTIGAAKSGSTNYNPYNVANTKKEYLFDECADTEKSNWQKTKDNCLKKNSAAFENNQRVSTPMVAAGAGRNNDFNYLSDQQTTNIECGEQTSTRCTIFLDDDEEYFEVPTGTGYSGLEVAPESGEIVEGYRTESYKVKKSEMEGSGKLKRNRKDYVTIGTADRGDSGAYEAKQLIKELENYHVSLKDPIVTKLWRFFEVSPGERTSQLSPVDKHNKRNAAIKKRKPKIKQKGFYQDESKLINRYFNEKHGYLKYHKRKLKSVTDTILSKLEECSEKYNETKKQQYPVRTRGSRTKRVRELVTRNKKDSKKRGEFKRAGQRSSYLNFRRKSGSCWEDSRCAKQALHSPVDKLGPGCGDGAVQGATCYHDADRPSAWFNGG